MNTIYQNSGFLRYWRNFSWLAGEKAIRLVSSFILGIWLARYLGPSNYGLFSYSVAFTSIFLGISKLGMDGIIVKEIVQKPESYIKVLGTAFWLKFLAAGFLFSLISLFLYFFEIGSVPPHYILIISLGMFFQSFEVIDFYFQAQVNGKAISKCKFVQLTISSILKILFIYMRLGLIYFIVVTLLDFVSLAISLLIAYKRSNLDSFAIQFDKESAKRILLKSWYLALAGIVVTLYMRIDQLMIGEILGLKQVGLYSIAVRLCEIWYIFPALISDALFPAIINAKSVNQALYQKRLIRLFSLLFWISCLIGALTCIFSSTLINKLFGSNYSDAIPVVIIYAWAGIFVSFGVASEKWLITEDLNVFSFWRTFSGLIINVIANLILIPKYGIMGAAWATLISYGVAGLFFDIIFCKTRYLFLMKVSSLNPRRMLDE